MLIKTINKLTYFKNLIIKTLELSQMTDSAATSDELTKQTNEEQQSVYYTGFGQEAFLTGITSTTKGLTIIMRDSHAQYTSLLSGDYKLISDKYEAANHLAKHGGPQLRNILCTSSKNNIHNARNYMISQIGTQILHPLNENIFHLKNWKLL